MAIGLNFAPAARDGWRGSAGPRPEFLAPAAAKQPPPLAAPIFREEFIDPHFTMPSAHVSSLCELPGGRLAAAWYAGSHEGARDVAVCFATREPGDGNLWSAPRALVTRELAARETSRFVKKVGNPVLFGDTNGQLCLLYVSIGFGGWSGSSLNLKQSLDGGKSWSPSQRLGLSPFFNVSELVKNGPVRLADGGWAVPIYHELIGKFPEVLWLHPRPDGFKAVKSRAFGGRTAFQPALVALDGKQAVLLCRAAGRVRDLHIARTRDAGLHWTAPEPTGLPNSDSGLDALRLKDGRILLAFNDSTIDRHNLRLAVSNDEARTWQRAAILAEEPGAEFSYPFLLQSNDGLVHVTYTWKRRGIKHVTFNLAWLDAPARDTTQ